MANFDYFKSARILAGRTELVDTPNRDIYREHGIPIWTLNYTEEGRGRIHCSEPLYHSEVGDLLLIRPNVKNDYGIEEELARWTHLWVVFHPEDWWYPFMSWPEAQIGVGRIHVSDPFVRKRIVELFGQIKELLLSPFPQREELGLNLTRQILIWADMFNTEKQESSIDPRIQSALRYLGNHLNEALSLDLLAAQASLSVSRFAHLFKEQLGVTPIRYLEQERLRRAADLLVVTSKPIAEISEEVGIPDPVYFTRLFKRHFKNTPRAFRKANHAKTGQSS